jgi:hypothetical protein
MNNEYFNFIIISLEMNKGLLKLNLNQKQNIEDYNFDLN